LVGVPKRGKGTWCCAVAEEAAAESLTPVG